MYELLSGQAAFGGETSQVVQVRILTAAPKPLARVRHDLPRGLIRIIERCLERDPADRFQDVAELAESLATYRASHELSLAEGVRRRLDLSRVTLDDSARATPAPPAPARSKLRRAASLALFVAILAPALYVLEQAAEHAPTLAPARAWISGAAKATRDRWCQASQLCGDFRTERRPNGGQSRP